MASGSGPIRFYFFVILKKHIFEECENLECNLIVSITCRKGNKVSTN
jgi:hypothetical protein